MYKNLSRYYNEIFPLTEARISFIKSFLKKTPCRVLDIGCAVGQLAATLAGDGHNVTGIDLDPALIETARENTAVPGLNLNFEVMNMTDAAANFPSGSFDLVLCLGNTLVHLPSLEEIGIFIKNIPRLLKKEGLLIIQVVNYDQVLAQRITELPVIETQHVRFERHYRFDQAKHKIHFQTRFTIKENMTRFEDEVLLYPLVQGELDIAMKSAGFKVKYFGDFLAHEYTLESPALISVSLLSLFSLFSLFSGDSRCYPAAGAH